MKTFILLLAMVLTINLNAQIVLDDFKTGPMNQTNVSAIGEKKYDQTGNRFEQESDPQNQGE